MKTPEERALGVTRRLWGDNADHHPHALQVAGDVAQAIREAVEEAAPRWIPVGERLPDVGELVSVLLDGHAAFLCRLAKDGARWAFDESERTFPQGFELGDTTHWAPLPPDPRS